MLLGGPCRLDILLARQQPPPHLYPLSLPLPHCWMPHSPPVAAVFSHVSRRIHECSKTSSVGCTAVANGDNMRDNGCPLPLSIARPYRTETTVATKKSVTVVVGCSSRLQVAAIASRIEWMYQKSLPDVAKTYDACSKKVIVAVTGSQLRCDGCSKT